MDDLDVMVSIAVVAAMWIHDCDTAVFLSVSLAAVSLAAVAYTVGGIRHAEVFAALAGAATAWVCS